MNRGTVAKKIRERKKRRQPSVTFRLHRGARSINYIQGKNSPSKFCATARKDRGSCSPRSRVRRTSWSRTWENRRRSRRGKKKWEKVREALLSALSFFKEFLPFPLSLVFFPSSRIATFFFPSHVAYLFRLSVSFCLLRYEEHRIYAAVGV